MRLAEGPKAFAVSGHESPARERSITGARSARIVPPGELLNPNKSVEERGKRQKEESALKQLLASEHLSVLESRQRKLVNESLSRWRRRG
jgi:hypothetical protein